MMRSLINRPRHGDASPVPGAISSLVTQLHAELRTLMTRKNEIRGRISSIRQVMLTLSEMPVTTPLPLTTPIHDPGVRSFAASPQPRPHRMRQSLHRACRIALMETETPASLDELYARIIRRGSFSFSSQKRATSVLFRMLCIMAQNGEVRLLKNGPNPSWQRLSTTPEEAPPRP